MAQAPSPRSVIMALAFAGLVLAPSAAGAAGAPAAFDVAGRATLLSVHAVGAQIYECKRDGSGGTSWSFREPIAALMDGSRTVGRHFAGPTWEMADGQSITGKMAASAPGATPDDVKLLKLDAVAHKGDGPLSGATLILRLDTRGGQLSGACPMPGELKAEPYSADYVFLR